MTVTGIIAEYNPFHLGHAYHLAEARRLTDADFLIVVMSGDFVQRGEPALFNKYVRAQMALMDGADLVLELPVPFATAGGEDFAGGSAAILDKLGVVNSLVFGSESGEIQDILTLADLLENETEETGTLIRQGLKEGLSYPAAVCRAVQTPFQQIEQLLSSPNNLLGVEYCRALKRRSSAIRPVTIKRLGNYHDSSLTDSASKKTFASASALRQAFSTFPPETAIDQISSDISAGALSLIKKETGISGPLFADDFTGPLFYRLLSETDSSLNSYLDVTPELANRILNQLPLCHSYTELAASVKSKAYTRLRINRALLHCLLGITKEDMTAYKQNDYTGYARVLGFKDTAGPLLKEISRRSSLSLLLRMKEDRQKLNETDLRLLSCNDFAANLYRMTVQNKFGSLLPDEYSRRLMKL